MVFDDMQDRLVCQSVNMLDTILHHYQAGKEWSWVRGMLRHHLNVALARITSTPDPTAYESIISDEMRSLITKFVYEQESVGVSCCWIRDELREMGIYVDDYAEEGW